MMAVISLKAEYFVNYSRVGLFEIAPHYQCSVRHADFAAAVDRLRSSSATARTAS